MKRLKILSLLSLFILSIGLIGCQSGKKDSIKFGSILTLTGEASSYGDMMKKGMDIALEEVNSNNDSLSFEIVYEDSKFEPQTAVSAANKLINIDQVDMITNITGSNIVKAVLPVAIENKMIVIDALSSATDLTELGGDIYFRLMPTDNHAADEIADWSEELNLDSGYILYANDDWGSGIKTFVEAQFNKVGSIVGSEAINEGETNFRNILLRVRESNPDVVFLLCYAPEAAIVVRQARELGIETKFIGSDNLSAQEFLKFGAANVEGVMFVLPSEGEGEVYKKFRGKYHERYNEYPSVNSIKSYDVVKLAAHVISEVGTNPKDIKDYLINDLQNYYGASGKIEFDANGDINNPLYQRMIYKDGKYIEYSDAD